MVNTSICGGAEFLETWNMFKNQFRGPFFTPTCEHGIIEWREASPLSHKSLENQGNLSILGAKMNQKLDAKRTLYNAISFKVRDEFSA